MADKRTNIDEKTLDAWAWVLLWAMGAEAAGAACCNPHDEGSEP